MTVPLYVINLERDRQRLEAIEAQVAPFAFMELIRVDAAVGRQLPDLAAHLLTSNAWSHLHKGTLGCFLSHVSSWEMIAKRRDVPFSIIIEDDAHLRDLNILTELALPSDCEFAFCNDRTAYGDDCDGTLQFRSVQPVLPFVAGHGRSVGGDGYLLTPNGAEKLLAFIRKDGFFSHVDLRLLAYCLDPTEDYSGADLRTPADGVVKLRRALPSDHHLAGYSMLPTLVSHTNTQLSSRWVEDRNVSLARPLDPA